MSLPSLEISELLRLLELLTQPDSSEVKSKSISLSSGVEEYFLIVTVSVVPLDLLKLLAEEECRRGRVCCTNK